MLVTGFAAGPWGTNCWVAATGPGAECVIIDPGMDAAAPLADLLAEHKLKPVAVLITHGHIDHMFSVTPVADGYGIPAYVQAADRALLAQPELAISAQAVDFLAQIGAKFAEPGSVEELTGDTRLQIAGLDLTALLAPGHTPGSMAFLAAAEQPRMFSGDLLFQGSIGRTDLPGGDPKAMVESLRRVVLPTSPETLVHCGHGPDTTIAAEIAANPYLQELVAAS